MQIWTNITQGERKLEEAPGHCWSDLVIFDVDSVKQQVIGPIFILLIRFK